MNNKKIKYNPSKGEKLQKLSVLILTGLLSLSVFAENGWYSGVGVVKSSWDKSIIDKSPLSLKHNTAYNFEYNKVNVKAFIGVKLLNNFAGEFQYTNFAKDNLDMTVDGYDRSTSLEMEGNSFSGALLYNFAPESDVSFFAKIGLHSWDFELSGEGVITTPDDGIDLFYGVGIDIKTTDAFITRIDYERFDIDDFFTIGDTRIDNFGISTVFSL